MRFHMGLRAPRALAASLALGSAGAAITLAPTSALAANTPTTTTVEELTVLSSVPVMLPLQPSPSVHTDFRMRRARLNVLDGQPALIVGALRHGGAGETVALQAHERHGWHTLVRTLTRAGGRFTLRYRSHRTGSEGVRVRFGGDATHFPAVHRLGSFNVYRLAGASWYGGGGGMACGGYLTSSTMGVANKTLPCGTLVTLRYRGRTVRIPVVDRGPYVAGREFDLTEATKRALDFEGVAQVWSTR